MPDSQPAGRLGALSDLTCSAEMNSACAEVLLRKTLVTPHLRRGRGPIRTQLLVNTGRGFGFSRLRKQPMPSA